MKLCNTCRTVKQSAEFYKRAASKDGLASACIPCCAEYKQKYYSKPEKRKLISEKGKAYKDSCREEIHIKQRIYRVNNIEKIRRIAKIYSVKISDKNKAKCKAWYRENKDRAQETAKKWVAAHKDRYYEIQRMSKARALADPVKRLNRRLATAIWRTLSGLKGGKHWELFVDFTFDQLKTHLGKKFTPEMSWENYGTYWHIDHKIPIAAFNFSGPDDIDFKKCWALKNLRPLEKIANIKKRDKVDRPFQPSLTL